MPLSDETLSALLDGEMSAGEAESIEKVLAGSPDDLHRLLAMQRADRLLAASLHGIDQRPLPEGLIDKIKAAAPPTTRGPGKVIPFSFRKIVSQPVWQLPIAASIALVIGLGLGRQGLVSTGPDAATAGLARVAGLIDPGNPLYQVLEKGAGATVVALDGKAGLTATPVLTFAARDGRYCREYRIESTVNTARGIACRDDSRWSVVAFASGPRDSATGAGIHPASGDNAPLLDQVTDKLIDGDPLDVAAEDTLIKAGWRPDRSSR